MKIALAPRVPYCTRVPYPGGTEVDEGLGAYGIHAADLRVISLDDALRLLPGLKTA